MRLGCQKDRVTYHSLKRYVCFKTLRLEKYLICLILVSHVKSYFECLYFMECSHCQVACM